MTILNVEQLRARLRNGAHIVDGISFAIGAGETFALLGESGCGKSMTALSLMRLLPDGVESAGGVVTLQDMPLQQLSERDMRAVRGGTMAMIFQEPGLSLNPVMTVGEQIAEVLELHGVIKQSVRAELDETTSHSTKRQSRQVAGYVEATPDSAVAERSPFDGLRANGCSIAQRCIALLEQVGIPDAARRVHEYPFQFSGGMKQRVMIAMALAGNPKLLIADEPTTALDVTIQAQVLKLLRDTQQRTGMAMLLITHDLGVVAENAHRVAVMYAGEIVEQASRDELFASPLHPYTQKLFAALPDSARRGHQLSAIPGNVPPLGSITQGCRFAPRCERAWSRCHEQTPVWTEVRIGQGVRCHLYGEEGREKGAGIDAGRGKREGGGAELRFPPSPYAPLPSLLEVSDLKVHFPIRKGILQRVVGSVKAVDGVSLAIKPGRTLALVGESGCGKTTLGKALLQLVRPTAGSVQFDGKELIGLGAQALRRQRASMQMVFQDPYASLNPKMRVAEILEEGMSALAMGGDSTARQAHIDGLLDKCGLARTAKWRYPHEFSGGQRQRIAIARALAVSPKLLICDEPTSALDVSVQAQILNLLKTLQQELGLSYLFITHNLAVVEYLAHEVCVMYQGKVVERGSAEQVLGSPTHDYTRTLLAAVPRVL